MILCDLILEENILKQFNEFIKFKRGNKTLKSGSNSLNRIIS